MSETRPIIIGGLHGSGAHLLPELLDQHQDVEIMKAEHDDEGAVLEGQAYQSVFEHEDYFGGLGAFAFHPDTWLDPTDDRWTGADFNRLREDWEAMWPADTRVGVEYSPSNVLRAKFLAEAFPNAVHLYVHRHPILDALATQHKTEDRSQPLDVLVRHWLAAYRQLLEDVDGLDNCFVVSFNDLRRRPGEILNEIFTAAELNPITVDSSELRSVGRDLWIKWTERPNEKRESILVLEEQIQWFGYDLEHPGFNRSIDVDTILGNGPSKSGVDVDALRPDDFELTDMEPPGTVPDRLLIVSFGTRCDVEPSIAAAQGFQKHGYEVTVCSTEAHRPLVEAADVPFVSVHPEASIDLPPPHGNDGKQQIESYLNEMYRFYDRYGEHIIRTLRDEINRADAVLIGRGVFFHGLLAFYFRVPIVELEASPIHLEQDGAADHRSVVSYAEDIITHGYAVSSFKIGEALDEAYDACGIDYRHSDEGFNEALIRMKSTPIIRAIKLPIARNEIPGLPDSATGFWLSHKPTDGVAARDSNTRTYLAQGDAPICLDFGKVDIFNNGAPAWSDRLLDALEGCEHRVIVIGDESHRDYTRNVEWVAPAAASEVYSACRFVVHDASPQTTIGCVAAATPALVIPPVEWDRGPNWAQWIEEEGAGLAVHSPPAEFDALLDELQHPQFQEGVQNVADRIDTQDDGTEIVTAFEQLFDNPDEERTRDWQSMVYINSLPIASWRKSKLLSYPLLREATASTQETLQLRETFLDAIEDARRTYPVYKADWPHKGEPLDLEEHDLPHETSGTEWWYYHTHLQTESGRDLSLFSVLFKRLFDDEQFAHAHAGMLEVEDGHYTQRSIGDPTAPDHIAPRLAEAPEDDYARRALREVYEKGRYPAPDHKAPDPPTISQDTVNFELGDMRIRKDDGDYLVALDLDEDRAFGFSLRFSPQKAPVLHSEDGVIKGVTSEANMFYYSITRMEVTGHVILDGERERVEGSGWYDHEFGGGTESDAALGGAHSWLWMGIQLDDGSDLSYTTVSNPAIGKKLHEDAILFVSPDGGETHYMGEIEQIDTWSSMSTYIEYGTAWRLSVPALDLELEIEATEDRQEMQSVIAQPAYWEGRIEIQGTRNGDPIVGTGICEQYGQGGDRTDYREFVDDVSREVQRSVAEVLPYDISPDHLRTLVASEDQPELAQGVDSEIFVEAGVRPIRTMVDRGGKGWRSMALLLCAQITGADPQRLQRYLAFPELIHTGSLIIDDIEDDSSMRRGGPTCHELFGEAIAINAGTAAYFMGERLQEEMDFSDQQLLRMYRLHFLALRGGHTGQAMDIYGLDHKVPQCLETGDFTPIWESVKATHRLKSALPAMVAARIGAVAADADRETEEILGDYFLALGYAFQLVDDAINLRGFQHNLKEHGEDLREGKITAPTARAFMVLDDADRRKLWTHLQADPDEMDIAAMLSLVEGCGAVDWCHDRAREVVENAWEPVDEHFPESQAKMRLRSFGWFVVDVRDY